MSNYEKPPLGARPTYISASDRIKELANAIADNSDRTDLNVGHIHLWASEILAQVDIIKKYENEWKKWGK